MGKRVSDVTESRPGKPTMRYKAEGSRNRSPGGERRKGGTCRRRLQRCFIFLEAIMKPPECSWGVWRPRGALVKPSRSSRTALKLEAVLGPAGAPLGLS